MVRVFTVGALFLEFFSQHLKSSSFPFSVFYFLKAHSVSLHFEGYFHVCVVL